MEKLLGKDVASHCYLFNVYICLSAASQTLEKERGSPTTVPVVAAAAVVRSEAVRELAETMLKFCWCRAKTVLEHIGILCMSCTMCCRF